MDADPTAAAIAELSRYRAPDDRAAASVEAARRRLARPPDPFDRHGDPVHVTGSALVVGERGTVLLLHKRLGIWVQPGGHVDPGELPAQAALREATEETGLAVRHPASGALLGHVDEHPAGEHIHLDFRYVVWAPPDDPRPQPGESQHVRWFSWAEADAVADAGLRTALAAAREAAWM